MKWENSIWIFVSFFFGVLVCYLTLQFYFFDIKTELDIPNMILSIVGILTGLYIAIILQKKLYKSQNQFSFLINKLDKTWNSFNLIAEKIEIENELDLNSVKKVIIDVIQPISLLKRLFTAFNLETLTVEELEKKLDEFESELSNLPAKNNVIIITQGIKEKVININGCFAKVLNRINKI